MPKDPRIEAPACRARERSNLPFYFTGLASVQTVKIQLCFERRTVNDNFSEDHRDKIEVPDLLAVEDLSSCKLNNKRKLTRLITQYRDIFSNIWKAQPSFFSWKIYPYTV